MEEATRQELRLVMNLVLIYRSVSTTSKWALRTLGWKVWAVYLQVPVRP